MKTIVDVNSTFDVLAGGLVVSCQAGPDSPLKGSDFMGAMAEAAKIGGAVGIRAEGPRDIREIKSRVGLPIIGLIKNRDYKTPVYITPTVKDAKKVVESGAEIVAVDATFRPRPDGEKLSNILAMVHDHGLLAVADISIYQEGIAAAELGFDAVATTLSGYTEYSPRKEDPDFDLIARLSDNISIPLFAEGRIASPKEARRALELGAHAVVVGSAITRPQEITKRFVELL